MLELEIFVAGLVIGKWHIEIFRMIDNHFGKKKESEPPRIL